MAKKKDGPALFELIHRSKAKPSDQLSVPEWMTGGAKKPIKVPLIPSPVRTASAPPPERERPVEPVETEEAYRPAAPAKPPAPPKPAAPVRAKLRSEKLLTAAGKRLRFSVTAGQAIAAGVVLLVLVVGVFLLGRVARWSSGSGGAPAGKAPAAKPKEGMSDWSLRATVGGERGEEPVIQPMVRTAEPPPSGVSATLAKGKYYLVVQGLMGATERHRAEAEAIAQFLNSQGERVAVMKYSGRPQQYIVLSLRSFDDPDSAEARRYIQAVEELGKLYRSQGGRYNFRQGENGWFVKG